MKKKYLKTIEDIEALKDTDTKIYIQLMDGTRWKEEYYQFVNGVLCRFLEGSLRLYNTQLSFEARKPFIEVEDEPSEDLIGKIGVFSNGYGFKEDIGVLEKSTCEDYPCLCAGSFHEYKYFRPLTPEEVEKYTGYKVVKEALK